MYVCACRKKLVSLLTFLLVVHISEDMVLPGSCTTSLCVYPHPSSWWGCHTCSSQTSWCWSSSALFTFLLHLPHSTSSWAHRLTWFLVLSRGSSSWHQRHWPFSKFSMLPAKRFLQNDDTEILHSWQTLSLPWVLKHSMQNPQKLWPHGVAISASRTGFLLDIRRNLIKNLLKR